MDQVSIVERRSVFILLSLAWLPAGIIVASDVRGMPWPPPLLPPLYEWLRLVILAPFGLPLPLACRWTRRLGYPRTAWAAFAVPAPLTAAAALHADLLYGPIAVVVCAALISAPAWILYLFLRRSRRGKPKRLFSAFEKSRGLWLID